jgi:hypothetical protein
MKFDELVCDFLTKSLMRNQKRLTAFNMAAAAMLEIQVRARKWAITTRF